MVDEPSAVRISATKPSELGTSSDTGPAHWRTRGFELQETIGQLYNIDARRVVLPAALDHKKYDVAVTFPTAQPREALMERVRLAINEKFALRLEFEDRYTDVYVLTVMPSRRAPKAVQDSSDILAWSLGSVSIGGRDYQASDRELLGVNVSGMTMEKIALMLEEGLDRLVIDETRLSGRYDLRTEPEASSTQQFFEMLREQCGLELKPAQRTVRMLVARSK
jgi:uncharacterized protein (TIGR03435 family)